MRAIEDKFKYIFLILLISIIYLFPLYKYGLYRSHDGDLQIVGIAAAYKAIVDGQIPLRWASDLNYGYGTPYFNFYYPLKDYAGSIVYGLGFSLQDSFKILIGLSFILSGVFFYIWMINIVDKKSAFLGAIFYSLAPYHFLDIYVRGQLGEMLAFVFIPLVLLFVERNKHKISMLNIFFGSIFFSLLILSHNILALVFSFLILSYILIRNLNDWKTLIVNLFILILGLMMSSFFWLPALYEGKYINSELFVGNMYKDHFLDYSKIIYSKWGFGSDVNKDGGLAPYIGSSHFAIVVIGVLILTRMKYKKEVIFWLIFLIISIIMSISLSTILWEKIDILSKFQFPWRFIAVSTLCTSVIICYVASFLKNNVFILLSLAAVLIISTSLIKTDKYINKEDSYYFNFPHTASYHGETTTIWTAGDAKDFAKSQIEIISGEGIVTEFVRRSKSHKFYINSKNKTRILDNTVYFPGWQVFVDGQKTPIEFQDINHRGLITFSVPKGMHNIEVVFRESAVRLFSNMVSLLAIVGISLIFAVKLYFSFIQKR